MQQPQPLCQNLLDEKVDAGHIATRPGKACDQTKLDGVFAYAEDDRDRRGRSLGRLSSSGLTGRRDNGDATADEVSHQRRQAIEAAIEPIVLDRHVLALDMAGFAKAFLESGHAGRGGSGRPEADEADDRRRLLRACRHRPRRHTAEQCNERAPLHSITSSAMASSAGDNSRPSALAAVRLIMSSYLVGCWNGRSPGFSPRKMRST